MREFNTGLDGHKGKSQGVISHVKTGRSLSCSDHALVEFSILRDMGQARTLNFRTLNFRKANLQLLKQLVEPHGKGS